MSVRIVMPKRQAIRKALERVACFYPHNFHINTKNTSQNQTQKAAKAKEKSSGSSAEIKKATGFDSRQSGDGKKGFLSHHPALFRQGTCETCWWSQINSEAEGGSMPPERTQNRTHTLFEYVSHQGLSTHRVRV